MLAKRLFVQCRAKTIAYAKRYIGETEGKTGLAAVPIEIGRGLDDMVRHTARELRERVTDGDIKLFLADMGKAGVIVPHPLGGWMAPPTATQPATPDVKTVEKLLAEINAENARRKLMVDKILKWCAKPDFQATLDKVEKKEFKVLVKRAMEDDT